MAITSSVLVSGGGDRQDSDLTDDNTPTIIVLLDGQITDLKAQLSQASDREASLIDEWSKLLDLLSAKKAEKRELKAEMRALMPPADEKTQKSPHWLLRLVGAR